MNNYHRHALLISIAIFLILAGLAGLVLPLIPGLLFILVGCLLLSAYNPKFEYWILSITKKYPPLHQMALDLQAFIERIIGKN